MMMYPVGKATIAAKTSKLIYSLRNIRIIFFIVAPFTFRIAISLRRCSHERLINEKIPNMAIIMQTADATESNFINVRSEASESSIIFATL